MFELGFTVAEIVINICLFWLGTELVLPDEQFKLWQIVLPGIGFGVFKGYTVVELNRWTNAKTAFSGFTLGALFAFTESCVVGLVALLICFATRNLEAAGIGTIIALFLFACSPYVTVPTIQRYFLKSRVLKCNDE